MSKVYGGRWKRMDSVGEGGQARVYRACDLRDGSTNWILKILKNKKRLDRFEREIRALETLDSPHIPRTEDFSIGDDAYHVSEDLGTNLERYVRSNPLDTDSALDLFEQAVSAVADAHRIGVVHRDIKPNNVVVAWDGAMAYLIDFGICQYFDGELTLLTASDEPFGNAAFAAPECSAGREEEPGPPCDVYSLGKLFYWMISNGGRIHRERLSEKVVERIATDSSLVGFYLMRLVRGTVVEDPSQRWTASRLLEEVHATKKLVGRVKEYERRGEILLADGFGVGDAFNHTSSRSATTQDPAYAPESRNLHLGDSLGDKDIGTAFEVPVGNDVYLETISLALEHRAGKYELDVWIAPDLDGKPDPRNALETFRTVGSRTYTSGIETVRTRTRSLLRQGQRYWILLSASAPNSEIAFWSAPLDFVPQPTLIAERQNGEEWEVFESPGGPGFAVRIVGRMR